jgi:hypothetical protein
MTDSKIKNGNIPNRGGRPKGSVNKVTAAAKDVISQAAEMLGGVNRLVEWAKEAPENEKAFWASIYPKMLPLQVNGDVNVSGALDFRNIIVNGVKPSV